MLASLSLDGFASAAALTFRLLQTNFALARNLHQAALIPWLHATGAMFAPNRESESVIEVERDGRVGIDLKFGSITFKEEEDRTYAVSLVDVLVGDADGGGTRVQMEVKVAANPEFDSILGVTERCRAQIVATLRAAAERLDGFSARTLLFEGVR